MYLPNIQKQHFFKNLQPVFIENSESSVLFLAQMRSENKPPPPSDS